MTIRVVTQPAFEPISLADAKLWCRIDDDDTDQDAQVLGLVIAMRAHAEFITGRAFVQRSLEYLLNAFPAAGEIELPIVPVVSVEYVQYIDGDGNLQSKSGSPSQFRVWTTSGIVAPLYGETWPATRAEPEAVRIGYTAGYPSVGQIPELVKLWMRARISTLFENREQLIVNNQIEIPYDLADGMLDSLSTGRRLFA